MALLVCDSIPLDSRFEKQKKIGEGTYGVVYQAFDRQENRVVALKKIRLDCDDEGIPSTTIREIAILRGLHHVNVIRLFNIFYSNHKLIMIFEFLEQDLKLYMDSQPGFLDPLVVREFMKQLLAGILYCHSRRVLHRDLKPQNLLIDPVRRILKLCDFGLARTYSVPGNGFYTREVVTLWYRPPEILLGNQHYSTPSDIWPSGCIFAEMLEKRPLFPGDAEIDQLFRIFRTMGTPNEQIWPGCTQLRDFKTFLATTFRPVPLNLVVTQANPLALDLLSKMLKYEPNSRINAREALVHPYFTQLS